MAASRSTGAGSVFSQKSEQHDVVFRPKFFDRNISLVGGNSFLGRFEFGEIHRLFVEFSQNSSVSNTHDSGPPGFRTQQTKQVGLSGLIQRCRCLVQKQVFRFGQKNTGKDNTLLFAQRKASSTDERERVLHVRKRINCLHQTIQQNLSGKVTRRNHYHREYDRHLRVAHAKRA